MASATSTPMPAARRTSPRRSTRRRSWARCASASTCTAARPGGGRLLNKDGTPHSLEGFRLTVESYLISFFNVTRLAAAAINKSAPYNEDNSKGVIIQTASIAGFEGQIGQAAYGSAKGGIISLTLIAARDLSPVGIRVNTIAPGTINTPAYGKAADQIKA